MRPNKPAPLFACCVAVGRSAPLLVDFAPLLVNMTAPDTPPYNPPCALHAATRADCGAPRRRERVHGGKFSKVLPEHRHCGPC